MTICDLSSPTSKMLYSTATLNTIKLRLRPNSQTESPVWMIMLLNVLKMMNSTHSGTIQTNHSLWAIGLYRFFRDEIEKRLRSLRKKIENAKKEDLDSLTTAAGAAGFRKQLFNCISCDKPLHMRTGEPVLNLPQPSSFPARISLRPNMTYEADHGKIQIAWDQNHI